MEVKKEVPDELPNDFEKDCLTLTPAELQKKYLCFPSSHIDGTKEIENVNENKDKDDDKDENQNIEKVIKTEPDPVQDKNIEIKKEPSSDNDDPWTKLRNSLKQRNNIADLLSSSSKKTKTNDCNVKTSSETTENNADEQSSATNKDVVKDVSQIQKENTSAKLKDDKPASKKEEMVVTLDSDDENEGENIIENLINDTVKQEIQDKEKLDSNEIAKLALAELNGFMKESDAKDPKEIARKALEELKKNNITNGKSDPSTVAKLSMLEVELNESNDGKGKKDSSAIAKLALLELEKDLEKDKENKNDTARRALAELENSLKQITNASDDDDIDIVEVVERKSKNKTANLITIKKEKCDDSDGIICIDDDDDKSKANIDNKTPKIKQERSPLPAIKRESCVTVKTEKQTPPSGKKKHWLEDDSDEDVEATDKNGKVKNIKKENEIKKEQDVKPELSALLKSLKRRQADTLGVPVETIDDDDDANENSEKLTEDGELAEPRDPKKSKRALLETLEKRHNETMASAVKTFAQQNPHAATVKTEILPELLNLRSFPVSWDSNLTNDLTKNPIKVEMKRELLDGMDDQGFAIRNPTQNDESSDDDDDPNRAEKEARAAYLKEKRDRLLGFVNDQSPSKDKNDPRKPPQVFECKVCELSQFNPCYRTDSNDKLLAHMEQIHYQLNKTRPDGTIKLVCKVCRFAKNEHPKLSTGVIFKTDDDLKMDRHMIKNHKCRPCGRILLTQKNLVQHINSLKCRGEIRCATCSAKMKSEEELIEHNEEEHDPRNKSRNRTQRKQKEIEQQMKMYDFNFREKILFNY